MATTRRFSPYAAILVRQSPTVPTWGTIDQGGIWYTDATEDYSLNLHDFVTGMAPIAITITGATLAGDFSPPALFASAFNYMRPLVPHGFTFQDGIITGIPRNKINPTIAVRAENSLGVSNTSFVLDTEVGTGVNSVAQMSIPDQSYQADVHEIQWILRHLDLALYCRHIDLSTLAYSQNPVATTLSGYFATLANEGLFQSYINTDDPAGILDTYHHVTYYMEASGGAANTSVTSNFVVEVNEYVLDLLPDTTEIPEEDDPPPPPAPPDDPSPTPFTSLSVVLTLSEELANNTYNLEFYVGHSGVSWGYSISLTASGASHTVLFNNTSSSSTGNYSRFRIRFQVSNNSGGSIYVYATAPNAGGSNTYSF